MESNQKNLFVNTLTTIFKVVIGLQILLVVFLLVFNYFSFNQEEGLRFTVRGPLHAYVNQNQGKALPTLEEEKHQFQNSDQTLYFLNGQRKGFMRIDYTDFSEAFTLKNFSWFLFEVFGLLIGLWISYLILQILLSLKRKEVFSRQNIGRIKWIGLSFILLPFIQLASNQLFYKIANAQLEIPGATLYSTFNWFDLTPFSLFHSSPLADQSQSIFPLVALGLIVLLIAEVFKKGLEIQTENKLTI